MYPSPTLVEIRDPNIANYLVHNVQQTMGKYFYCDASSSTEKHPKSYLVDDGRAPAIHMVAVTELVRDQPTWAY